MLFKKIDISVTKKYIIFFVFIILNNNTYSSSNFDYYNFINNLESFSASFVQYTYNENDSLIRTSTGKLFIQKNQSIF